MKNILILGGTGFIGRNLVNFFSNNPAYQVTATHFSRPAPAINGVKWVNIDLTKQESVDRLFDNSFDCVLQAAAVTSGIADVEYRPHIHNADNAIMNSLLFPACWSTNVKQFVFFSCSVMYSNSDIPIKEDDFDAHADLNPKYFGPAWTKIYLEKMAQFYAERGQTRFTIVRHSNVYGPYDKFDLARSHMVGANVTKVMRAADKDEIIVWGDGQEGRDILYIDDLVSFVSKALEKQKSHYEIFNVGGGQFYTVQSVVENIIRSSGKNIKITYDTTKPTLNSKIYLDNSKSSTMLGWAPRISLNDGINLTMSWWKENYQ